MEKGSALKTYRKEWVECVCWCLYNKALTFAKEEVACNFVFRHSYTQLCFELLTSGALQKRSMELLINCSIVKYIAYFFYFADIAFSQINLHISKPVSMSFYACQDCFVPQASHLKCKSNLQQAGAP